MATASWCWADIPSTSWVCVTVPLSAGAALAREAHPTPLRCYYRCPRRFCQTTAAGTTQQQESPGRLLPRPSVCDRSDWNVRVCHTLWEGSAPTREVGQDGRGAHGTSR